MQSFQSTDKNSTGKFAEAAIAANIVHQMSVFSLIKQADIVVKAVMLILFFGSLWSWAIIFDKLLKYAITVINMGKFEESFWSGRQLDQIYEISKKNQDNPLADLFNSAMDEWNRNSTLASNADLSENIRARIGTAVDISRNRQLDDLESKLPILAMLGANATFIGLFGTVWGIMDSFQSFVNVQNLSILIIAPKIAEALLATAIGLVVAIPAAAFYNILTGKLNKISSKIDDFASELSNLISREIDKELK